MNPFLIILPVLILISLDGSNRLSKQSNYKSIIEKKRIIYISLEKTVCFLLLLSFWGLTAFRSINIGNDTRNYVGVFISIATQGILPTFYMEIGYQYFNLAVSKIFGINPQNILISCATISYLGVAIYIWKKSKNYYLSVCFSFCFLFSCFTNTIRQGLAMILGIIAYQLIIDDKKYKAIIIISIAMTIHLTAVVLFALFFFKFIPKKFSTILIIITILLMLSVFGTFNPIFMRILPRGQSYFQSDRVGSGFLGLGYELIRDLFFCFLAYKCYQNSQTDENKKRMVVFVACTMLSCLSFNMNLIRRANGYFLILMIVELPNVLYDLETKNRRLFSFGICTVMVIYFFVVQIIRPEWNHLIPYEFWRN